MTKRGRLWAIGYDRMERAAQVRDEVIRLGEKHYLVVLDTAVVVRYRDGITTLDGKRFLDHISGNGHTVASCMAAIALGVPPLTEAGVGALLRNASTASDDVGIDEGFICEVEELLKPGTSTLFVLDQEGDMDGLLHGIRGLGGTVLKTTVDLERARLIQATLAASTGSLGTSAESDVSIKTN
jgi:uncharacterized membrane protein